MMQLSYVHSASHAPFVGDTIGVHFDRIVERFAQRMRTKDGYLMVGAAGQAIWERCAAALGHPEWCADPRFATNERRMQNRTALEAEMEAVLTTATSDHWVEVLEAAGVPCGPVYDYAQMFADPAGAPPRLLQYARDPDLGEVPHIRTPIKIGEGVRLHRREAAILGPAKSRSRRVAYFGARASRVIAA